MEELRSPKFAYCRLVAQLWHTLDGDCRLSGKLFLGTFSLMKTVPPRRFFPELRSLLSHEFMNDFYCQIQYPSPPLSMATSLVTGFGNTIGVDS